MKVKKAKKILKNQFDEVHENKKAYASIKWDKERKVFRVLTMWGQVKLVKL